MFFCDLGALLTNEHIFWEHSLLGYVEFCVTNTPNKIFCLQEGNSAYRQNIFLGQLVVVAVVFFCNDIVKHVIVPYVFMKL